MKRCLFAGVQGILEQTGNFIPTRSTLYAGLILGLFLFSSNLNAQSPSVHWTDLDSFAIGYQLDESKAFLTANEQFSVNLYLSVDPGYECLGAGGTITFSDSIGIASLQGHDIPGVTWLGTQPELKASNEETTPFTSFKWQISRKDYLSQQGSGLVLTLNFVAGNDSIGTNDLIKSIDGGLIVIENIDMRIGAAQPASDELKNDGLKKVNVRDFEGNLLMETEMWPDGNINLNNLPSGPYLLEIYLNLLDKPIFRRIIKE